ncbi:MAG: type II/IV secretion system ATPase subunit [Candidatus Aenigmarchaeota archaeon]|nr:type II/IV secretion system ATPase subunit [Candidatus Aenigmarchaeota archaeon]
MVDYEVKDGILRFNCLNWVIPPSIEDSEATMATVIDTLQKVGGIERIILAESRENEYPYEQTKMLVEIADFIKRLTSSEEFFKIDRIVPRGFEKLAPKRLAEIRIIIFELLRKDPVGAYLKVLRLIEKNRILAKSFSDPRPYLHYIENVLLPLKEKIENLELIRRAKKILDKYRPKDRTIYREIFSPIVRPNFMLTRFLLKVPKDARVLDRYKIAGNILVEILKVPNKVRPVYHITPPEFVISEEKALILQRARSYLAEHRPSESEISDPERAREVFFKMGISLIKDIATSLNTSLSNKEIEELTNILVRYTAGFGILELLLADEKITDIYINSPVGTTPIYVNHSEFEECETNLIPTREEAEGWATRLRLYSGRPLDEANPVLDAELIVPGGRARITVITRTLSPYGLSFAIRRHRGKPWTFPLFLKVRYFNPLFAGLMSFIIDGGRALLVAGSRGSGKTSLLGSMMFELMRKYRIVVIEDTLELPVIELRRLGFNVERLKSRSVITRVESELPAEEALRTALRLGDSVLIIGEVRSTEALALFEAMRIGALANFVAGTIHGESAYGVYDRVIHDLGVKPTSFKALDLIVIANNLKTPDGLHTFKRVVEVTEVRKHWKEDPLDEGGFVNLMEYSAKEDTLKPTSVLLDGESEVLNQISNRVREWKGHWERVWENILLRAKIKETVVEYALKLNRPEILEAEWVVKVNEAFHLFSEEVAKEVGYVEPKYVYEKWIKWFKESLR